MANKKISAMTALGATPDTLDVLAVVDVSDVSTTSTGETKKITVGNLILDGVQTLTNKTFTNCDANTQSAGNNTTKIATTAFVTTAVASSDTLAEVLANGNTTGATNLVVTAGQAITTDTISETTAAAGVTIDSVLVKDNTVTATTFTGALVGNSDTATKVYVTDNESTAEANLISFVADAATATGNHGLEMDGSLTYTPSTGTVTSTVFAGALTGDVTGNLTGTASLATVTDSTAATAFPVVFNDEANALLDDTGTFTYKPSTGTVAATAFTGALTGNASSATLASTVTVTDSAADTAFPVVLHDESNALLDDTGAFTYNPSSSTVTATTFVGALTGDASGTAATVTGGTQSSITSCANLVTVGTIGTGVWQGTAVDGTYVDIEGTEVKSTGPATDGYVLTANGSGGAAWEAAASGSGTVTSITPGADAGSGTAITSSGTLTSTGGDGIDTAVSGTTTTFTLDLNELSDISGAGDVSGWSAGDTMAIVDSGASKRIKPPAEICIACSDETTALTTGDDKAVFMMPRAMTVTEVKFSLSTTSALAATDLQLDVRTHATDPENAGTSIFFEAAISAVIPATAYKASVSGTVFTASETSSIAIGEDAFIMVDIDTVDGTEASSGLKVWLLGYWT